MTTTFVLVPGYWLGGWAWDAVAQNLRQDDFKIEQVTLPGLESTSSTEDSATLADQVSAVTDAVGRAEGRVVLVGHSGAGAIITGVADVAHDRIDELVFVDSGPAADGAVGSPELSSDVRSLDLPSWEALEAAGSSLKGLDAEQLAEFRARAVPHPAGPARTVLSLSDDERHQLPVTLVCTSYSADTVREMTEAGHPWFEELRQYADVRLVDLPTGHWPMWSRPGDLAAILRSLSV